MAFPHAPAGDASREPLTRLVYTLRARLAGLHANADVSIRHTSDGIAFVGSIPVEVVVPISEIELRSAEPNGLADLYTSMLRDALVNELLKKLRLLEAR